jgi:hypothetical protein
MYVRHRIRLIYPRIKCLVEYTKSGHKKFYPMELVEIYKENDEQSKPANSVNNGWESPQSLVIDENIVKSP